MGAYEDLDALEARIAKRAYQHRVAWVCVTLAGFLLVGYALWRAALWLVVTLQSRLQWL